MLLSNRASFNVIISEDGHETNWRGLEMQKTDNMKLFLKVIHSIVHNCINSLNFLSINLRYKNVKQYFILNKC